MEPAICLVYFQSLLDESEPPNYGILFEDGFILCLCCGGCFESEDYKILVKHDGFKNVQEALEEYFKFGKMEVM